MTMVDVSYILNEWDTYCRNDVESTRKMFITTANPYREEKITKDILDHFAYCYKIDKEFDCGLTKIIEETKEKENMFVNNQVNEIKVTFNGRECNVLDAKIKHPGDPRELPTIELECSITRSSIPYHEYAKQKKTTEEPKFPTIRAMDIKNVIFNPPATIVFWADGTKTVVKAENEDFDPEKGLAMAITKKILGNTGHYFEIVKKLTKDAPVGEPVSDLDKVYNQGLNDMRARMKAKFEDLADNLVVGNRITRKFFNEFNEFVESISKEDEA